MRAPFFDKKFCDRCHVELTVRTMSMFNEDVICPACKEKETQRPDYDDAVRAEHEALKRGDRNFPGIGLKKR